MQARCPSLPFPPRLPPVRYRSLVQYTGTRKIILNPRDRLGIYRIPFRQRWPLGAPSAVVDSRRATPLRQGMYGSGLDDWDTSPVEISTGQQISIHRPRLP